MTYEHPESYFHEADPLNLDGRAGEPAEGWAAYNAAEEQAFEQKWKAEAQRQIDVYRKALSSPRLRVFFDRYSGSEFRVTHDLDSAAAFLERGDYEYTFAAIKRAEEEVGIAEDRVSDWATD